MWQSNKNAGLLPASPMHAPFSAPRCPAGLSIHDPPCIALQVGASDAVVEAVRDVFARHGAVPMASNLVGFAACGDGAADSERLLSRGGSQVCPSDRHRLSVGLPVHLSVCMYVM
jgi:hypothetical protein